MFVGQGNLGGISPLQVVAELVHRSTDFILYFRYTGFFPADSDATEAAHMVQFYNLESEDEENDQQHTDNSGSMALAVERDRRSTGIRMTPKVPPTFDGQASWFEFEGLIDDWLGITTLTPAGTFRTIIEECIGWCG